MLHRSFRAAALVAVALAASSLVPTAVAPAHAQGATVPANRTTEVGFFWALDPRTCGNLAKPRVRIRQPKNGKVTTKWVTRTVQFPGNRGRKCNGTKGRGTAIYYTPNRGYRGPERFGITASSRLDGRSRNFSEVFRFRVQ